MCWSSARYTKHTDASSYLSAMCRSPFRSRREMALGTSASWNTTSARVSAAVDACVGTRVSNCTGVFAK
eukprot:3841694-Rhodomonas_salina.1